MKNLSILCVFCIILIPVVAMGQISNSRDHNGYDFDGIWETGPDLMISRTGIEAALCYPNCDLCVIFFNEAGETCGAESDWEIDPAQLRSEFGEIVAWTYRQWTNGDLDGDGITDGLDNDIDGDGVINLEDSEPAFIEGISEISIAHLVLPSKWYIAEFDGSDNDITESFEFDEWLLQFNSVFLIGDVGGSGYLTEYEPLRTARVM